MALVSQENPLRGTCVLPFPPSSSSVFPDLIKPRNCGSNLNELGLGLQGEKGSLQRRRAKKPLFLLFPFPPPELVSLATSPLFLRWSESEPQAEEEEEEEERESFFRSRRTTRPCYDCFSASVPPPIRRSSVSQGCCGRVWKRDTKNPY